MVHLNPNPLLPPKKPSRSAGTFRSYKIISQDNRVPDLLVWINTLWAEPFYSHNNWTMMITVYSANLLI